MSLSSCYRNTSCGMHCEWVHGSQDSCTTPEFLHQIMPAGLSPPQMIQQQTTFWTKRAQEQGKGSTQFQEYKVKLNVQVYDKGVAECRGRIQGHYPIFLPDSALYNRKLVQQEHVQTLHGGLGLTMAKICET